MDAQKFLNPLNMSLFDLAARVAHDIQSPIAVMEMGLHRIEKANDITDINILKMAIQRIRDISNNLLDQSGNNYIHNDVNIKIILDEIILLKRYEWLNKNYELNVSLNNISESDRILGASIEIKRILSNLLNNALEACLESAQISIVVNKQIDFIDITISDNGIGMPQEKIAYYLGGGSSKHSRSGLGLINAKKYMTSINGELWISSEQKKGTSLKLRFKLYN